MLGEMNSEQSRQEQTRRSEQVEWPRNVALQSDILKEMRTDSLPCKGGMQAVRKGGRKPNTYVNK